MRILLTNDDGINAPGLACMEKIARAFGGPEAEIWVVAPAFEQSGVGHCISYTHPTMILELGERRYAAEGSPADCVLAGIGDIIDKSLMEMAQKKIKNKAPAEGTQQLSRLPTAQVAEGLGPKLRAILAEQGITRFEQIANWSEADVERIDATLGRFAGRITRDQWVEQAKLLSAGDDTGFTAQFGQTQ